MRKTSPPKARAPAAPAAAPGVPSLADRSADLLHALGERVRRIRRARRLTLKEAAGAARLSPRFLADVEAGRGNISVARLADLARALETPLPDLLRVPGPPRVALLGLRGAGKSTVGRIVAAKAGLAFHELDAMVEESAGLPLPELFAVHGEAYYRRLEREALERVLGQERPTVVAAGGGIVTDERTFARLREGFTTVWLRARPEEHMTRVEAQGDLRPMARRADAMAELKEILSERSPLYAQADHVVDTSGKSPERVAAEVLAAVA